MGVIFFIRVSFGTSGTWRYFASNVKWICGVLDANWSGFNSSDFYRVKMESFFAEIAAWSGSALLSLH